MTCSDTGCAFFRQCMVWKNKTRIIRYNTMPNLSRRESIDEQESCGMRLDRKTMPSCMPSRPSALNSACNNPPAAPTLEGGSSARGSEPERGVNDGEFVNPQKAKYATNQSSQPIDVLTHPSPLVLYSQCFVISLPSARR